MSIPNQAGAQYNPESNSYVGGGGAGGGASAAAGATSNYSFLSKYLPMIGTGLSAGGQFMAGSSEAAAARTNARTYLAEAGTAANQSREQEAQQRIAGAKVVGGMTAAAGEAGGGYGGSTGRLIGQSARNVELDALNTRYKGQLQRWSFAAQAQNLSQEGRVAQAGAYLKAGSALLRGYSGNYTGTTPFQYFPTG